MKILSPLAIPAFRNLFAAQALSLLGSGLATVALGLLAYALAGDSAGLVLGTALAIKMVAYVVISPLAAALAANVSRKRFLVSLDLARAALVLCFVFVDAIWQVYALIFGLFSLTAGFTPVFQATIPDVVKDEESYINALSLSRLAFNTESILSPIIAGLLLTVMTFNWMFLFTSAGFVASALLVGSASLKRTIKAATTPFLHRVTSGMRIFAKTPRLRGLMTLNMVVALIGANIYVNSIILAHQTLGGDQQTYLNLLLVFGMGSVAAALALRPMLDRISLRSLCLSAAFLMTLSPVFMWISPGTITLFALWATIGACMSVITTSSGLLLRASARTVDRPSVFAAQFSLSHACWLITYLLVAWLGKAIGPVPTIYLTASLAFLITLAAIPVWRRVGKTPLLHTHDAHDHDHMHTHDAHHQHAHIGDEGPEPHQHPHHHTRLEHSHIFVIDDHHLEWPR